MVCFAEANQTGKYSAILKKAKDFVTGARVRIAMPKLGCEI